MNRTVGTNYGGGMFEFITRGSQFEHRQVTRTFHIIKRLLANERTDRSWQVYSGIQSFVNCEVVCIYVKLYISDTLDVLAPEVSRPATGFMPVGMQFCWCFHHTHRCIFLNWDFTLPPQHPLSFPQETNWPGSEVTAGGVHGL